MASKKKKNSTAGLFFTFFLKAIVIILGLVILAMSVYLVKQIILQKNSEADSISDEAVFEGDDQVDDLMMASSGDAEDVLLYDGNGSADGSGNTKKEIAFDSSIVVLNATETSGLAGAWKEKLEGIGFTNVQTGNYTGGLLESSKIVVTEEYSGDSFKPYLPDVEIETLPADQVPCDVDSEGVSAYIIIGNADNILAE